MVTSAVAGHSIDQAHVTFRIVSNCGKSDIKSFIAPVLNLYFAGSYPLGTGEVHALAGSNALALLCSFWPHRMGLRRDDRLAGSAGAASVAARQWLEPGKCGNRALAPILPVNAAASCPHAMCPTLTTKVFDRLKFVALWGVLTLTFAFPAQVFAEPEETITIATLLKGGWQIVGYTGTSDGRSAFILFRHPDEPYLVQCRASYDVTRTPSVTLNCYKLQ